MFQPGSYSKRKAFRGKEINLKVISGECRNMQLGTLLNAVFLVFHEPLSELSDLNPAPHLQNGWRVLQIFVGELNRVLSTTQLAPGPSPHIFSALPTFLQFLDWDLSHHVHQYWSILVFLLLVFHFWSNHWQSQSWLDPLKFSGGSAFNVCVEKGHDQSSFIIIMCSNSLWTKQYELIQVLCFDLEVSFCRDLEKP